jgi:hypothetical protein
MLSSTGFIVKVKKILECICVNCGKLKADIVSLVLCCNPFSLLHPTLPIFWGLSPGCPGEPRAMRCGPFLCFYTRASFIP